jgi:hypothetical protein
VFATLLFLSRRYFLATPPPWATDPLLLEFYLGAIIAFLFLAGSSLPPGIAVVAIILSAAGILDAGDPIGGNWVRLIWW